MGQFGDAISTYGWAYNFIKINCMFELLIYKLIISKFYTKCASNIVLQILYTDINLKCPWKINFTAKMPLKDDIYLTCRLYYIYLSIVL